MPEPTIILDAAGMHRALARIAHEIAERNESSSEVVLVGVQRGGVHLARRLASVLNGIWAHPVPVGSLDVAMHRDDLDRQMAPKVHPTEISFDITGKTIVLVDALNDLGRPKRIQLAVLVDRGHRELPIKADFVGKNVPTSLSERIDVLLREADGQDLVCLEKK